MLSGRCCLASLSEFLEDPDGELLLPLKEAKPAKGGKAKSKRSRGTKSPAGSRPRGLNVLSSHSRPPSTIEFQGNS